MGLLFWHATHGDNYSLKSNGGAFYDGGPGTGLSVPGQQLWNLGHDQPDLGAYTGSYAGSHCGSAAGY